MFDRHGPRDRDAARRPRRWLLLLATLIALAAWAIPALATETKEVTVDPAAAPGAAGFTDLDGMTYAQAKARLDQLSTITLPVAVPGLEQIGVDDVALGSNDAGRALSLSGSASLPAIHGGDVDLLVTAVWPDDESTEPELAIAAKTDDLALSELNPLWDGSYGAVSFETARLAVSTADLHLDPDALPDAARAFFPEPADLTGGVNFAGRLHLGGRLADAFAYAGYSGDIDLEGSLSASAAALFGHATDDQLGDLHLKATLGKSPTAPDWLADRTSTYELALENGRPSLSVDEDLTVALDGTTNRFHGEVAIAPAGAIEGEIALVGALDAPFGLDALDPSKLSDIKLRLARSADGVEGGLAFAVDVDGSSVDVTAGFVSGGGTTRADFAIDGPLTVSRLAAFGGELLGTPVTAVPGADGVSLDRVSFSFSSGVFSVGAQTTIKQLQADAVLTLRKTAGQPAKPLLGLRLTDGGCDHDCIRMSSLLPGDQAGEILGGLELPALNLVATPLTELSADDLTPQEQEFFGDAYEQLPDTLTFSPGLNLEGRLPLDALRAGEALGYPAGAEVALSGTLGAGVTLSRVQGSTFSLENLELEAKLPPATNLPLLPDWVDPSGPTTLKFSYATDGIAASFATAADITVGGAPFHTTIDGRLTRSAQRTTIGFTGTLTKWRNPFGLGWLNTLDDAKLALDVRFGGAQPADVDASVSAEAVLGGRPFALEFGLSSGSSTTASLTARFGGGVHLGEIAGAFPDLGGAAADIAAERELNDLELQDVSVSLTAGARQTAVELAARTEFRGLTSDLLVGVRPGRGFTLGIKAAGEIDLNDLVSGAPGVHVTLPRAAAVFGSRDVDVPTRDLTDAEFDFYKPLYGCADDATRDTCSGFRSLKQSAGLSLLADFELGASAEQMAGAIGIQTSGHALLEGKLPAAGGRVFSLKATLGNFHFDQQPEWFDHGSVALQIDNGGLGFVGALGVKIHRDGESWMPACEGGTIRDGRCYDLLDFSVTADVRLGARPSLTLTGALTTDHAWRNAFGQDWLEIRRVALQLGVTLGAGPEVTMGFQGDVKIGSKDVAAALKVGLAPAPPLGVRPNLIGFSAASKAGISLGDLVWLNNQISGTKLDASGMPDVSLRNLYLQYSQETDRRLCLTQGVRFSADLYVGKNLPPVEAGESDANGCRVLNRSPETPESCIAQQANGCLASVYGRLDSGGLVAGGELSRFALGPVAFDDSSLTLALTPSRQELRLHGGARIATTDYVFARGRADLDISRDGFAFSGDAALFNDAFHGYLKASGPLDLESPSFTVEAWLRADAQAAISGVVGKEAANLRVPIAALGKVLQMIQGGGSVPNIRDLPHYLEDGGASVPSEVRTMTDVLGDVQDVVASAPGHVELTLDRLLQGFPLPGSGGVPGWRDPAECPAFEIDGKCWAIPPVPEIEPGVLAPWAPNRCHVVEIAGRCYLIPPGTTEVPGICDALGVPSDDCSWASLMRRYVRPALLAAAERATGIDFDDQSFEAALAKLVSGFADTAGSIVSIDCAYFSANASNLAKGIVDVDLAARARLFGQPVEFGTGWDFRADGGSPGEVVSNLFESLFSPSETQCPALPPGHEQVSSDVPSRTLGATLTPATLDEGGEATLRATFDDLAVNYPAVAVNWGDGSPVATIPAGESRTVSASHRYANEGNHPVSVVVQDAGGFTRTLSASVRNVGPALTALAAAPVDENAVVTLRGAFTDPGADDRHTVGIDWGDGSPRELHDVHGRTFALPHRYADDGAYRVTVDVADDTGAAVTGRTTAVVRNVAPSAVTITPLTGDDVAEGSTAQFAVDFADPGESDEHTVTVDWGNGHAAHTFRLGRGQRHLELQAGYPDDGTFDLHVTVDDDDGGRGESTLPVQVRNMKPLVSVRLDASKPGVVRLVGTVTDPGVLDGETVTIDWGTGKSADRYQTIVAKKRTFDVERTLGPEKFSITVHATDDDGASGPDWRAS